jgi:hypothetical protein
MGIQGKIFRVIKSLPWNDVVIVEVTQKIFQKDVEERLCHPVHREKSPLTLISKCSGFQFHDGGFQGNR